MFTSRAVAGWSRSVLGWLTWTVRAARQVAWGAYHGAQQATTFVFWPWPFGSKPAPKPVPLSPPRRPVILHRSRSLSHLRPLPSGLLADRDASRPLRRALSACASTHPREVKCGDLTLSPGPGATEQHQNRSRYVAHLGTPVRQGGLPAGRIDALAAARALGIKLRIWTLAGGQRVRESYAPRPEVTAAPAIDLCRVHAQGQEVYLLREDDGRLREVGKNGESFYACLAYALDVDHAREHRAAYEALCAAKGAHYMAYIDEFLPPRSRCIAELRGRVVQEVQANLPAYRPLLDQAVRRLLNERPLRARSRGATSAT